MSESGFNGEGKNKEIKYVGNTALICTPSSLVHALFIPPPTRMARSIDTAVFVPSPRYMPPDAAISPLQHERQNCPRPEKNIFLHLITDPPFSFTVAMVSQAGLRQMKHL